MTRIALVLVATIASASLAEAQTVESFDRLALLVNQGDRIAVTNRAGQELQGQLIDLSPTALSLQIDDARHNLDETDVAVVRRRHRDSLQNGAVIGFISGAVVAGILMADENMSCCRATYVLVTSLFGAAGAGIGVGFDAGYVASQVIYTARRSTRRVAVSPLLSRDRRGLAVSLEF